MATLRHWERRDRVPRGPALVLLTVISRDPNAVLRALSRQRRDDYASTAGRLRVKSNAQSR